MFTNILVPIDLSDDSRVAALHAGALASRGQGQVTLMHVDEVAGIGLASSEALAVHMNRVSSLRDEWVAQVADELQRRFGVETTLHLSIGSAAREILDYIDQNGVDLVVMGRRGIGGVERFLLGSTSKRLVTHAAVPVLVVPAREEGSPAAEVGDFRRVLTPTDFSEDASRGILAVRELLCGEYGATQIVAHVAHVPMVVTSGTEPPFIMPMETRTELTSAATDELRQLVASLGLGEVEQRVVVATSVSSALLSTATEVGADLIALPTHGKGAFKRLLFGSTTLRLLSLSPLPLLIMPREWLAARGATTL